MNKPKTEKDSQIQRTNRQIPELGFPDGSDGKESACSVGELGSIPTSGRSPGEGNAWRATIHSVTKSDMTEQLTLSLSEETRWKN